MSGWISHILVFCMGVVAGVFLASRQGLAAGARDKKKALKNLYRESRGFFDELRNDLRKPEFFQVREFAIVESSQITFVSEDLRFVYYEEDFPDLKSIAKKLDRLDYVDDVARGKTPIYRMREQLVDALQEL
jgi:hypothetical protein